MRTILSLIALTTLTVPALAAPQSAEEAVTVRIQTAGIDVTTTEGRAELEARIDAKIRTACTVSKGSRFAYGRTVRDETCISKARAAALAEVERLALSKQGGGRQVAAN